MLNASTLIGVQAIIMSVHTQVHVYTYSVKTVLDAIICNKITSIVNVIRLMLFTVISIVNEQGR